MPKELKEVHLTLRISRRLKAEVESVADETQRSLNNAAELLLEKGLEAYRQEGFLVDTRPKVRRVPDVVNAADVLQEQENRRA